MANQDKSNKDPIHEMLLMYKIRLEKAEKVPYPDYPPPSVDEKTRPILPTALAVLVAGSEIVKIIRTLGVPILFEVNALRRLAMGQVEGAFMEELAKKDGKSYITKGGIHVVGK